MREDISTPRKVWVRFTSIETRPTNNHKGAGRGKCSLWQPECLSEAYSMEHSQIVTHPIYLSPSNMTWPRRPGTNGCCPKWFRSILFFFFCIFILLTDLLGCRDGAVVRALASHQCGPGSIPRSSVICGLSLLVLYSALRGFLRVLRCLLCSKNQHIWLDLC